MDKWVKRKDVSIEQRAWEDFKFITFNMNIIAFGFGALTIIFLKESFAYLLLLFVAPICYFIAWKYLSKKFLKNEVKQ